MANNLDGPILEILRRRRGWIGAGAIIHALTRQGYDRLDGLLGELRRLASAGKVERQGPAERPQWRLVAATPRPKAATQKAIPPPPPPPTWPAKAPTCQQLDRGLYRIERPGREQGYLVKLHWRGQKRRRFFSDARHADSLASAIAYREQALGELERADNPKQGRGVARSNTGLVGVSLTTSEGQRIAQAVWTDAQGRRHRATASVAKWGEEGAIRIVLMKRLEGVGR